MNGLPNSTGQSVTDAASNRRVSLMAVLLIAMKLGCALDRASNEDTGRPALLDNPRGSTTGIDPTTVPRGRSIPPPSLGVDL